MKRILKAIAILFAVVVVLVLSAFLFITIRGIPSYEVQKVEYKMVSSPESIERGKKLASMLCASCHKNTETGKLTGKLMKDAPPEFGKIFSANITQDKTYGIGEWTDAEIVYLLRTGIKRDGKYAPPYMAKLPHMADEDINAIISFLHSDDPMVTPDPTPDSPCEPSFLTKFLCNAVFKPFPYPTNSIALPDTSNMIETGKYLAYNLECFSCHSADFKTNDYMNPEKSQGYCGGGNKPLNLNGQVVVTANITPDNATGIGSWSEEKFIKAVRYGLKEGEVGLQYPMIPYINLTDKEAAAIFQYLKTIPPVNNKIDRIIYE